MAARKRKELSDAPESVAALGVEARKSLDQWLRGEVAAGRLPRSFLKDAKSIAGACLDWHISNGVQRADWPATIRNWFRKEVTIERDKKAERRERYRYEHPQEERDGMDTGFEGPGDTLRMIYGGKN